MNNIDVSNVGPDALLEYIIQNLVEYPDEVEITTIEGDEENIIELRVAETDVGKVIGKNGTVARALRTLISALAAKDHKNYILEIID